MIWTSNYVFEDWGPIFTDQVIAAAIIDRLVHHSHIFVSNGNSFRMKQKLQVYPDQGWPSPPVIFQ